MPEQEELQQIKRELESTRRATQAQRRNLVLFRRRPQPPRDVQITDAQLSWEEPQETRNVTQYRVYAPDDRTLYTALPVGSRQLTGLLPTGSHIFVSSFNEHSGLESRRVLAGVAVPPPPPPPPPEPPGLAALASNVQSATATTNYATGMYGTQYGFSGIITLNTADLDYVAPAKIVVAFRGPDGSTQEQILTTVTPAGSTVSYSGTGIGYQNVSSHTGTLVFTCYNADNRPTDNPYTKAVDIAPAATAGVVGREVPGAGWTDPVDRLQYATIGLTPTFADPAITQPFTYWVSENNGSTWRWIGWRENATSGVEITFRRVKPTTFQTWKVAMKIGTFGGDPSIFVSLPAGSIQSAGFTVTGLAAPAPNLGIALTVAAGAGGNFPYDATTPDGLHYWKIPSISYNDAALVAVDGVFFFRITAQDYDRDDHAIGPEQAFAGTGISGDGGVHTYSLVGNYGSDGYYYTRRSTYPTGVPTNLAYVKLRRYVGNRKNQTTGSFTDPTSMTKQTDLGGDTDVWVAVGGAVPDSALRGAGNVTIGALSYDDLGDGTYQITVPYTPPSDSVFTGVVVEVELPDRSATLRADGTMSWGGNPLAGDSTPYAFGPFSDSDDHRAVVTVPAPSVAMTARVRVRSCTVNATNAASVSPSATITLEAYANVVNPGSGAAYTACATFSGAPTVIAPYEMNGTLDQDIIFPVSSPSDPRFSGYEIWSNGWPDDANFYQETGMQTPGTPTVTITLPAPSTVIAPTFWLVSVSIDDQGVKRRNPFVQGVTPSVVVSLGTGAGVIDARKFMMSTLAGTDFKLDEVTGLFTFKSIDLAKAANISTEFHIDPVTGKFSMLDLDMSKASRLSAQFQWDAGAMVQKVVNLDASVLKTGAFQVGGPSMVSQMKNFDTSGNLIGFVGDDTAGTGYVGAWFKRCGIGGSAAAPNFYADAAGNVVAKSITIADATGNYGSITSSGYAWFKNIGIGGTFGAPKILADAAGNLVISGTLISGNIAGAAATITGSINTTQVNAGTFNGHALSITVGSRTLVFNGTDCLRITDSATGIELAMNAANLYVKYASGPNAGLTAQLIPGTVHVSNAGGFNTGHNAANFYCQNTAGTWGSFTYAKPAGGSGTITVMGGIITAIT